MSNKQAVGYTSSFIGDGTSTTFSFNLRDFPNGLTFGESYIDFHKTPTPTDVESNGGDIAYTPSIVGTVVTLTFTSAPNNGQRYSFSLILVF